MGFPVVLKIELAVTEFFDFRFESGVVELTKEHPGMAIRVEQAGQGCRPKLLQYKLLGQWFYTKPRIFF